MEKELARVANLNANGLISQRIFGPIAPKKCQCGRCSGDRFVGMVCPDCNVEVMDEIVRDQWCGHIKLPYCVFVGPEEIRTWLWKDAGFAKNACRYALDHRANLVIDEGVSYVLRKGDFIPFACVEPYAAALSVLKDEILPRLGPGSEQFAAAKKIYEALEGASEEKPPVDLNFGFKTLLRDVLHCELATGGDAIRRILGERQNAWPSYIDSLRQQLKRRQERETPPAESILREMQLFEDDRAKRAGRPATQFSIADAEKKRDFRERQRLGGIELTIKNISSAEEAFEKGIPFADVLTDVIEVIPPRERPLDTVWGWDITNCYRRVIGRCHRIRKLEDMHAPEVILHNEGRELQAAVSVLVHNLLALKRAKKDNDPFLAVKIQDVDH